MNEGRVCTVTLNVHQLLDSSSRRMPYNTFGSQPWTMVIYEMRCPRFCFSSLKDSNRPIFSTHRSHKPQWWVLSGLGAYPSMRFSRTNATIETLPHTCSTKNHAGYHLQIASRPLLIQRRHRHRARILAW